MSFTFTKSRRAKPEMTGPCLPIPTLGLLCILTPAALAGAEVLDDFEDAAHSAAWGFSNGAEFPGAAGRFERAAEAAHGGQFGGRLEFDFTGGGAYVSAGLPLPPPASPSPGGEPKGVRAVTLWLYKATPNRIGFRVTDSTGQTFQKQVSYHFPGWQQVRVRFGPWAAHWGGPKDGVFHWPARGFAVLIERHGGPETGALWIDDVAGETEETRVEASEWITEYTVTTFGPEELWGFSGAGSQDEPPLSASGRGRGRGRPIRYDFTAGGTTAGLHTSISLLGDPQALTLRLRSDGSGHRLRLSLGSHFQTFHRLLATLEKEGEQSVTLPLGPNGGWEWGGGENDGVWRLPLRVTSVTIEKNEGGAGAGTVEFLELRCATRVTPETAAVLLATPAPLPAEEGPGAGGERPSHLRLRGKRPTQAVGFALTGRNLRPEAVNGTLTTTVRDWAGTVFFQEQAPWSLPGQGVPVTQSVEVPLDPALPFAEAEFRFVAEGQRPAMATTTWTRPLEDAGDPTLDPASPFGMGVYLYRYPGSPAGLAQMDRAAALAQAAGCKWSREEFLWHRIEPRRGEFDWSFYDAVVETATRHGISIYGLIDYWSEWAEPYTPAGIADYAHYCTALVHRYQDRIKHWEIWNEPNIFFWQGPREMYVDLLKAAYQAIKSADPEAQVLGCSTAGIDTGFIRLVAEKGGDYDILTIHPYRGHLEDAGFIRDLQNTAALTEELYGAPRPVWITEMGWSTQAQGGVSERQQAGLVARCYLCAIASGAAPNVSWYDFREDGADPFYNEHHLGVLRHDLTPKPACRAFATVARTLAGRTTPEPLDVGEGLLAYRFTGNDRPPVVALWSPEASRTLALRIGDGVTVTDLMGATRPLPTRGGIALLGLAAGSPVFLEGLAEPLAVVGRPLELTARGAHPGKEVTVHWQITNPLPGSIDAALSFHPPADWPGAKPTEWRGVRSLLAPGQTRTGEARLPIPSDAPPGSCEVMATLRLGEIEVQSAVTVEVMPAVLEV